MAWRTIAVLGATTGMLLGVLVGCGQEDRATDEPTHGPTSRATDEPTHGPTSKPTKSATAGASSAGCRQPPASSGPASSVAELRVTVPATATSGSEVQAQVSLHVRHDGGRIVAVAARSQLLVVRGHEVVAVSASRSTLEVPLQLRAGAVRRAQVVPATVRLVGCAPGASQPLPPGRYDVVAVLAYGQDPLNAAPGGGGAHRFQLVSAPASLTVV